MEKPNLQIFSGTLLSLDRGLQLGIARNLARVYAQVLEEPLPADLQRLITRLEGSQTER
jgi:Anti-sigma factor NepR